MVLRSLKDALREHHNVAVAEVEHQDLWQRCTLGIVGIASAHKPRDAALEGLRHSATFIQRALFRNLRLRHSPALIFELDDSLERGDRIERMLQRLHDEEASEPGEASGERPGEQKEKE